MKRGKLLITIITLFIILVLLKQYDFSFREISGKASSSNVAISLTIKDSYYINWDEFDDDYGFDEDGRPVMNFSNMTISESQNISNFILRKKNYGKIEFIENINISSPIDFNRYINISHNLIIINSTFLPNLNKSATLKLYNLTFADPKITKDGIVCPAEICVKNSYNNGILSFNVTHFTSYGAEETSSGAPSRAGHSGPTGKSGTIRKEIKEPEKPEITHKPGKLFDISILIPEKYRELVSNDKLMAQISMINIRKIGLVDVNVEYSIEDSNKSVMYKEMETKSVENEITYVKEIYLPKEAKVGDYMFLVRVKYNNDTALAGYSFKIIKQIHLEEPGRIYEEERYYILSGIIILIALFIISIIIEYKRHKEMSKYLKKISEKELMERGFIKRGR